MKIFLVLFCMMNSQEIIPFFGGGEDVIQTVSIGKNKTIIKLPDGEKVKRIKSLIETW